MCPLPYDAPPLSCGHICQGAVQGPPGEMPDRGKGKTFRAAGGHSSNLLFDDGMNELDFQSALHVLVHAHMGIGFVDICQKPHGEITAAVRETAQRIYDVHRGSVPPFDEKPEIIPLNAC